MDHSSESLMDLSVDLYVHDRSVISLPMAFGCEWGYDKAYKIRVKSNTSMAIAFFRFEHLFIAHDSAVYLLCNALFTLQHSPHLLPLTFASM